MSLIDICKRIESPLEKEEIMDKLLKLYAESTPGSDGLYLKLTHTEEKLEEDKKYRVIEKENFEAMLFNKWKKSVISMTESEYKKLAASGKLRPDFIKMRNYLKTVPDVKTEGEARKILYGEKQDKELQEALEKYNYSTLGESSGWEHIHSRYINSKKEPYFDIEHRLYLNVSAYGAYPIMSSFLEKCEKKHIPYYFKFDPFFGRDDTIVIYSGTKHLEDYIEILREIKKENPDLTKYTKKPPVLTGVIDDWIGYGSEPTLSPEGKNRSFNQVRSELLENSLESVNNKWIIDHLHTIIRYGSSSIPFSEYIAIKTAERMISSLEDTYMITRRYYQNKAARRNSNYNEQDVINYKGYSLNDIKSETFKQMILNGIRPDIEENIKKIASGRKNEVKIFEITLRNGNKEYINAGVIHKTMRSLAPQIARNDKTYTESIKNEIKAKSPSYGVDPKNIAFDTHAKKKIIEYEKSRVPKEKEVGSTKYPEKSGLKDSISIINDEFIGIMKIFMNFDPNKPVEEQLITREENILRVLQTELDFNIIINLIVDNLAKDEENTAQNRVEREFKIVFLRDIQERYERLYSKKEEQKEEEAESSSGSRK